MSFSFGLTRITMQHSFTEENYLKIIHGLSDAGVKEVNTNAIAESTSTRAASVTDMLKKLSEKGLIHYKKYQGVKLTPEGEEKALAIIRRHRLWEVFLVEKLNLGWDEVHDIAEDLEHINSSRLVERLDEFLGYPRFDPHGDPIPDARGHMPDSHSHKLAESRIGEPVVITGVLEHSPAFLQHLDSRGLAIGSILTILEVVDYDRSLQVKIQSGGNQFISHEVSRNILVQSPNVNN
jgi:DtxR family Mn-dependent transcriptional regulator